MRKPTLIVSAPKDGAQFAQDSDVLVQSKASDEKGIVRVELWTDGFLYRVDVSKEVEGLPNVSLTQTWPAKEAGSHTLQVKAINRDGGTAESPVMNITVVASSATPTTAPQSAPAPTGAPTKATTSDCQNDAAFVSDVTVPDGTVFKPSDAINKVWRVRNTGTCAWGEGYKLTFADGAPMDASSSVAVPPTVPGATADIAVPMIAPRTPGTYRGRWKLSALNGAPFGQTLTIVIRVVDTSQPTPAPNITPTPAALVMAFKVNRKIIPYGDCATLKWDVDNASAVKLDNKGVIGHDTRLVCPTETKDYTLQAFVPNQAEPVEKVVTVEVKASTSGGTATISAGDAVNLTTGIKNVGQVDFLWDATKTFQPKNGASFALMGARGFNDVPQDECLNATTYSSANLSGGQVAAGSMICFKTSSGRFGKLRIESSEGDLKFRWVTW